MSSESKDEDTLHTGKCDGTFKIRSVTKLGDGEEEGLVTSNYVSTTDKYQLLRTPLTRQTF